MSHFTDYKLNLISMPRDSTAKRATWPTGQVVVIKGHEGFNFRIFNNKGIKLVDKTQNDLARTDQALRQDLDKILAHKQLIPPYSIADEVIQKIFKSLEHAESSSEYTLFIFCDDDMAELPPLPTGQVVVVRDHDGFHFYIFNKEGKKIVDKHQDNFSFDDEILLQQLEDEILLRELKGVLERQPIHPDIAHDLVSKIFKALNYEELVSDYMLLMLHDIRVTEPPQLSKAKGTVQVIQNDKGFHFRIFDKAGRELVNKGQNEILFSDEVLLQQLQGALERQPIPSHIASDLIQKIFKGLGYTEPTNGMVTQSYPIFVENQVLASNDLNLLTKHFDDETQFTRSKLIGVGILNGLTVASIWQQSDDKITAKIDISAGTCITPDGSYISLDSISLTYYEELQSTRFSQSKQPILELFDSRRNARTLLSQKIEKSTAEQSLQPKLLNPTRSESPPLKRVDRTKREFKELLKDKILVLVTEHAERSRYSLLKYDTGGKYQDLLVRFFLIPYPDKKQLDEDSFQFLKQKHALHNGLNSKLSLQHLDDATPTSKEAIDKLADCRKSEDLQKYYESICTRAIDIIKEAFPKGASLMSSLTGAFNAITGINLGVESDIFEKITKLDAGNASSSSLYKYLSDSLEEQLTSIQGLQYFYGYLSTLVAAYNELIDAIIHVLDYLPDATQQSFLMLGTVQLDYDLEIKIFEQDDDLPDEDDSKKCLIYVGKHKTTSDYYVRIFNSSGKIVSGKEKKTLFPDNTLMQKLDATLKNQSISEPDKRELIQEITASLGYSHLDKDQENHDVLARSQFIPTPKTSSTKHQFERIAHLYRRLLLLCEKDSFELPSAADVIETEIKFSGDRTTPLSQQAIPFYLKSDQLRPYWNYDVKQQEQGSRQVLSAYPQQAYSQSKAQQFPYHAAANDFYHIEGHLGKNVDEAIKAIQAKRERYNLGFEIIAVSVNNTTQEDSTLPTTFRFHQFADLYPGMEPLGGVPKGGTFILVYEDAQNDIVIADLALPYHLESDTAPLQAPPSFKLFLDDERLSFLEIDDTEYTITLEPKHGIVEGLGIIERDGTYYFQPSQLRDDINQDSKDIIVTGRWGKYLKTLKVTVSNVILEFSDSQSIFLASDDKEYPIRLEPASGTVQAPKGITKKEGKYYFQPSQLKDEINDFKDITITGTWDNISKTLTATVHQAPLAQFWLEDKKKPSGSEKEYPLNKGDTPISLITQTISGTFKAFKSDDTEEQKNLEHLIQNTPSWAFIPKDTGKITIEHKVIHKIFGEATSKIIVDIQEDIQISASNNKTEEREEGTQQEAEDPQEPNTLSTQDTINDGSTERSNILDSPLENPSSVLFVGNTNPSTFLDHPEVSLPQALLNLESVLGEPFPDSDISNDSPIIISDSSTKAVPTQESSQPVKDSTTNNIDEAESKPASSEDNTATPRPNLGQKIMKFLTQPIGDEGTGQGTL